MASYVILGAGKFGHLALSRLSRLDPAALLTVVDQDPEAVEAARDLSFHRVEMILAEGAAYVAGHLSRGGPWDWLIPMVPVHVALSVLRRGPLAPPAWEITPVPEELAALAALSLRGREGELYLSRATHLCPDDCPEPEDACPVTGEGRSPALHEVLAELNLPGWRLAVIASRLLTPGVGGYRPGSLLQLADAAPGFPDQIMVTTACRCHAVVHALRRVKGGGA